MYILPFKSAFGYFNGVVVYLSCIACFGAIGLFSLVDLTFFAYDYLATLFLGYLSLRIPSGVASPQLWGAQIL